MNAKPISRRIKRIRYVALGFQCNNSCVFCAQGVLRQSERQSLDVEAVRRQIEDVVRSDNFTGALAFVGGEPMLHDALCHWVGHAKRLGARWILVQTNGRRLAYPGYVRSLADSGLDALDISLHGSTAAMHEYHTNVFGSWAQTLLGMEQACKAGIAVGATTVITRSNFRHLEAIVGLAHRQGASAVHLEPASPFGRAFSDWARVVPAMEMVLPHVTAAIRSARLLGLEVLAFNQATSPRARRLFAGIGTVESQASQVTTQPSPAVAQAVASSPTAAPRRPVPGHQEIRNAQKKTGEALREIFPDLFNEPIKELSLG